MTCEQPIGTAEETTTRVSREELGSLRLKGERLRAGEQEDMRLLRVTGRGSSPPASAASLAMVSVVHGHRGLKYYKENPRDKVPKFQNAYHSE